MRRRRRLRRRLSASWTRSIASRRAVRTAGFENSGWPGRRLSRTAVIVAPWIVERAGAGLPGEVAVDARRETGHGIESSGPERVGELLRVVEEREVHPREIRDGTGRPRRRNGRRERVRRARRWLHGGRRLEHGRGRDEFGMLAVEARHRERTRSDRLVTERCRREIRDGDVREEMRRRDRLSRQLQKAAERRREGEGDHPRTPGLDGHLVPRSRGRPHVRPVLEDTDRVRHVIRGDRLTVVPEGVVAELEGPHRAGRVDGPVLGQIRDERPVRAVADEAGEDERDEVAVGLGPGGQRADRHGTPEDALAIWPRDDRARGRLRRRDGRGGWHERRGADEARDDCEQYDQGPDDERIVAGHRAPSEHPDRGGPPRCRIRQ